MTHINRVKSTPYDPQINRAGRINPGNAALVTDQTTRLVGAMFPSTGSTLDTGVWTPANNGTASAAGLSGGIVTLTSGTANNGYGSLITTLHARFLFVNPNLFRMGARLTATTAADCTRYIGAMDITAGNPPTLNNGYYFAINGAGTLSVNHKAAGSSAVSISSGSFNGDVTSWTADTNVHGFEIIYFVMAAWFFIDGVLIHKFTPTTAILNNDLALHCFAASVNSGSGTTSGSLEVWASSILRFGKELTRPQYRNISTNTTTVCKIGPGSIHSISINKKPTSNGVATVYDNAAASGNIIATIDINNSVGSVYTFGPFGTDFQDGLTIVTTAGAGTSDLTVTFD